MVLNLALFARQSQCPHLLAARSRWPISVSVAKPSRILLPVNITRIVTSRYHCVIRYPASSSAKGVPAQASVLRPLLYKVTKQPFSSMSWMDSWSRPSANSKIPAPLYLLHQDVLYCQACGRVMNSKKVAPKKQGQANNSKDTSSTPRHQQEVKYCSTKCRSRKPGPRDRMIEDKIAALLDGVSDSGIDETGAKDRLIKGDRRMVVTCDEIEAVCFGSRFDPEKVFGRRKNRKSRALDAGTQKEWRSVDMESNSSDSDDSDNESMNSQSSRDKILRDATISNNTNTPLGAPKPGDIIPFNISHTRPSQMESEINFNAGGGERSKAEKISESPADLAKRLDGAKRAEEREMVRRAARRVVVFGVNSDDTQNKNKTTSSGTNHAKPSKSKSSNNHHQQNHRKGKRSIDQQNDDDEYSDAADDDGQGYVSGSGAGNKNANNNNTGIVRRKAEALMNGVVVEPSFAKGNWSIRWRE